jgi:hypothetical protein
MTKIAEKLEYAIKGLLVILIAIAFLISEIITKQEWLFIGYAIFLGLWIYYMWKGYRVTKSPEYMAEIIRIEEWRNGYSGWKPR